MSSTLQEPIEIAKFWRNRKGEAVIVQLREYKGRTLIDCRVHFTDKEGKLQPTHKGLTMLLGKLPELSKALAKAEKKAAELGLLEGADE
jgi:hypothetical protein